MKMMKNRNIFPMLLVTLTSVSCQMYSGDSPSANSASLSSLSENLFENYFSTPSKYVLCMREVSRYIYDMTSEEQDASIFKYVVGQIQENTYHIENFGTVSTGGKPVDEAGAVWHLTTESFPSWYGNDDYGGLYSIESLSVEIACISAVEWSLDVSSSGYSASGTPSGAVAQSELSVRIGTFDSGNSVFELSGSGVMREGEYETSFRIDDEEGMVMLLSGEYSVFGTFFVDIFRDGRTVDSCVMTLLGEDRKFSTGRDDDR